MSISAPAAIWDDFERIKYYEKLKKEPIIPVKSIVIDTYEPVSIEHLKTLVCCATSYKINAYGSLEDDSASAELVLTVPKSEDEMKAERQKLIEDCEHAISYTVNKLIKWAKNSDKNKEIFYSLCAMYGMTISLGE